jgi:vacuolar protein sorting-associated protein 13A/C
VIDPWTFTIGVRSPVSNWNDSAYTNWHKISRASSSDGLHLSLSARERLDLNISSTFVELALATLNTWFQEGSDAVLSAARGAYAPYRIRNQTGSPILVWSESDNAASSSAAAVKILNDEIIDWRFDDWKTMREVYFALPLLTIF